MLYPHTPAGALPTEATAALYSNNMHVYTYSGYRISGITSYGECAKNNYSDGKQNGAEDVQSHCYGYLQHNSNTIKSNFTTDAYNNSLLIVLTPCWMQVFTALLSYLVGDGTNVD